MRASPSRLLPIVAVRHGRAFEVAERLAHIAATVARASPEQLPSPKVARLDAVEAGPTGTRTTRLGVYAGKTGSRYCSWRTRPVWSAGEDSRRLAGLDHGCDRTRDGATKQAILALESGACCKQGPWGAGSPEPVRWRTDRNHSGWHIEAGKSISIRCIRGDGKAARRCVLAKTASVFLHVGEASAHACWAGGTCCRKQWRRTT